MVTTPLYEPSLSRPPGRLKEKMADYSSQPEGPIMARRLGHKE